MGKVKRKYDNEVYLISKDFKNPLKQVAQILPKDYTNNDLLVEFKLLFPFQWQMLVERQNLYKEKDIHLKKIGKKQRYFAKSAECFFFSLGMVKNILSGNYKEQYAILYQDNIAKEKKKNLYEKRKRANSKIFERIDEAKINAQNVNPTYLKKYINKYHEKGTSNQDKLVIIKELEKFDTLEVTRFFYKLNDSEHNNMIRLLAFKHLQAYGHYAKLRKNFKGKKKTYQTETTDLSKMKPKDLYVSLKNSSVHVYQEYDYFISHSSKDKSLVRECIQLLNNNGKVCYCDWSMDEIFLKRDHVSIFTKEVLKVRMEQSKQLIFLKTKNSMESTWVKFELDYFKSLQKEIFIIDDIKNDFKNNEKFI